MQNNSGYITSKCGVNLNVIDNGTTGCTYSCRFVNELQAANTIDVINIISNVFRYIHFIIVNILVSFERFNNEIMQSTRFQ